MQGGLLSGKDPTAFNTADPLRIWIIQVGEETRVITMIDSFTLYSPNFTSCHRSDYHDYSAAESWSQKD
jgi:hypothetical protein